MRRSTLLLILALLLCGGSIALGLVRRPEPAPLAPLTVEVLNGCGVDGLASRAAARLRLLGQDAVEVADAPDDSYARTVLIDRRGRPWLTRRLAQRIGPATVVLERVEQARADVTLILGADHATLRLFAEP